MENYGQIDLCPRCGFHRLKGWKELTDYERLLANSQPASAEFTLAERKKHRFCTRCWFEDVSNETLA